MVAQTTLFFLFQVHLVLMKIKRNIQTTNAVIKCSQWNYKTDKSDYVRNPQQENIQNQRTSAQSVISLMPFRQRSNSIQCERTERTAEDMKRHVQRVHEGILYPCDQCCHVSKTKGYLGFHVKSQHSCSEEYCSNETYNKNTLKSHFDTEHGIVKYKCEIMYCNFLSAWKRSLRAHNLTRARVQMMQTEIWK